MYIILSTGTGSTSLLSLFFSVLFALCENGAILQICLHTMTPFSSWNDLPIKDFVVLEGNTTNECNLLVLVDEALTGYQATAHLVLLSWPGTMLS